MKILFKALAFFMMGVCPVLAGVELKGTSSTLESPLGGAWSTDYRPSGIKIKVESKNAADAVNQFLGRGCDFALTGATLTIPEEKRALGHNLLRLPVALSAVAITYNLPGIPSQSLKLTPEALSNIFLGVIKKWNDPALKELNPKVTLPDMDILVLHRQDENSLNDFFPAFLAQQNHQWTLKREKDKNLHWPVGQNVKGNAKVLEKMRKWPGVIAAVDFSYAQKNQLPVALIRNSLKQFIAPSLESITAATTDLTALPEDMVVSLSRSRAAKAYPLCTFAWILTYQDYGKIYHNHAKGQALMDFLNWALSAEGQKAALDNAYVPLPEAFLPQVKEKIQSISF
jgi:phosphate transport system substrate-binding protein